MENSISPKYKLDLIKKIDVKLQEMYSNIEEIQAYFELWQKEAEKLGKKFEIAYGLKHLDTFETLKQLDNEILIRIGIELGVEIPMFIPAIPIFRINFEHRYPSTYETFEKALKQVQDHPDMAIGLANSTLESLIKEILTRLQVQDIEKETLYSLAQKLLKEYSLYPEKEAPEEIRNIGSALLNVLKNIEKLRSSKTDFHGKSSSEPKIESPLYAYFIINTVSAIGLFLDGLYQEKFSNKTNESECSEINIEDIF
ncbi:MAG: abortive infection family protein [Leptospiraceae bacterium]|nr:abortive infection family protein [Leptospiraceae bacterium]